MKKIKSMLSGVFSTAKPKSEYWSTLRLRHEWDRQRARAKSPSELAEIDAIFSRAL